mmetsp:Transcript_13776/g.20910  ORF Transcript_13776/g.20910 Transcript_13776/m.20910 type:complete len:246 (-) Transcript_13776:147-884(-)
MMNVTTSAAFILFLGIAIATASSSNIGTTDTIKKRDIELKDITTYIQKSLFSEHGRERGHDHGVQIARRGRRKLRDLSADSEEESCTTVHLGDAYLTREGSSQIVLGLLELESSSAVDFDSFDIYMKETKEHCYSLGGELYKLSVDINLDCEAYYNYEYYEDDMIQNSAFVWEAAAGSQISNFPLCVQNCESTKGAEDRLEELINDECFDGVEVQSDSSGYSMKVQDSILVVGTALVAAVTMVMI